MLKHSRIINQMTLVEKASLMSGKGFWDTVAIEELDIPFIVLADGPHGIRRQMGDADHLGLNESYPATCYPTAATLANSWNEGLCHTVGQYLGKEASVMGVDIVLGPGMNIKRSPLGGRNFEYFSEDPYLTGILGTEMIKGIQSNGVGACPKHFAANSQEKLRMANDSVVDVRTLREIYTAGFEMAVKAAKPLSIMSAYNKVNGVYANESEYLLDDLLRKEWGFDGFVVSDWGGSNDHAEGVLAGSHLEMPTTGNDGISEIIRAIENGRLKESKLDERVDQFLDVVLRLNENKNEERQASFDIDRHHAVAKKAADECIVLLKNEEQILPLKKGQTVALIGDFAQVTRYQGAGSSLVNSTRVDNAWEVFMKKDISPLGYAKGFERNGKKNEALLHEAEELAKRADVVLLYLGLSEVEESEGRDREHLDLAKNQIELLARLAEINKNIVVVLAAGSVVSMPWIDHAKGLVHGYLPGQAGAESIVDVLLGVVNPSGKLAETYPLHLEDTPAHNYFPGNEKTSEYREGIFVGYRYYDKNNLPVLFPFGYGLSYTAFDYEQLQIKEDQVSIKVTNVGDTSGAEVVQMYVSLQDSVLFRAMKELKGFKKVFLNPGESQIVTFNLTEECFRYFNVDLNRWDVEAGTYEIHIGANVSEIKASGKIEVEGSLVVSPYDAILLKDYYSGNVSKIDVSSFEVLLGREVPEANWDRSLPLSMNDTISQMVYAKSILARAIIRVIEYLNQRSLKKGVPNLNLLFIHEMTFRGIAKMTGGAITMRMAEGLVDLVNGHFFKGIKKVFNGALLSRKESKKIGENTYE